MDAFCSVQWDYWLNHARVLLGEAVWQSMDIDPRSARPARTPYIRSDEVELAEKLWAIQQERIDAAVSHLRAGTLPGRYDEGSLDEPWISHVVALSDFRAWGESLPIPFTFPGKFPKATQAVGSEVPQQPKQDGRVGTCERENLLALVGTLAELGGIDLRPKVLPRGATKRIHAEMKRRNVEFSPQSIGDKLKAARELIAPKGPPGKTS